MLNEIFLRNTKVIKNRAVLRLSQSRRIEGDMTAIIRNVVLWMDLETENDIKEKLRKSD